MQKIVDQEKYTKIILKQEEHQFLQSWEWGEFQRSTGKKVIRWVNNEQNQVAQAFIHPLPFGFFYIYWPRAVEKQDTNFIQDSLEYLRRMSNKKTVFIRIECVDENKKIQKAKEVAALQPADTLVIDLQKAEKDLLSEMKSKTRYNIRLAKKKEVEVSFYENSSQEDIEDFYELVKKTEQRHGVNFHSMDYYTEMLKQRSGAYRTYLVEAKKQEKLLAAGIMIYFGNVATYLHGASSHEQKNVMAPYRMQWKMIQKAKEDRKKQYDFFGIAPRENDNKIGAERRKKMFNGITRFKKGFGGGEKHYGKTYEVPVQKAFYKMLRALKSVSK